MLKLMRAMREASSLKILPWAFVVLLILRECPFAAPSGAHSTDVSSMPNTLQLKDLSNQRSLLVAEKISSPKVRENSKDAIKLSKKPDRRKDLEDPDQSAASSSQEDGLAKRRSRARKRQAILKSRGETKKQQKLYPKNGDTETDAEKQDVEESSSGFWEDPAQKLKPKLGKVKVPRTVNNKTSKKFDSEEEQQAAALEAEQSFLKKKIESTSNPEEKAQLKADLLILEKDLTWEDHDAELALYGDTLAEETKSGQNISVHLNKETIGDSIKQAESMVLAHKQAKLGQEKAVIGKGKISRELNPSKNVFKDLVLKSSSILSDKLPKVAICFVTRGDMPLEKTWRIFFESVPLAGVDGMPGWETLFNIYTHPQINYSYPASSIFFGTEVENRVKVEWGQFGVMAAEIRLFETALEDPLNERFMLASETCIPIYPATVVWAELLSEGRSRINACRDKNAKRHWTMAMEYRQSDEMVVLGLERIHWRKSSQWVDLIRSHAELVASDTKVKPIFEKECYIKEGSRFCVADEHYLPTMLAVKERENETDCIGQATHVWWDGPYAHPRTWQLPDITQGLILRLRRSTHGKAKDKGSCESGAAIRSAGLIFPEVVNVSAVKDNRRKLLQEKRARFPGRINSAEELDAFQQQLAVIQPYTSTYWSLLADNGVSIEEIEEDAYQEIQEQKRRKLLTTRRKGIRHDEQGSHWDLAREFLKDYESMNNGGCPVFARKFADSSEKVLAEMATKFGTLEQAFLATGTRKLLERTNDSQ